MLHIGCHLSSTGGFLAMGKQASKLKADTFQFFTRNPRGGRAKAFNLADAEALNKYLTENDFVSILAHAPYTLNPAAAEGRVRDFAFEAFADDLSRLSHIPAALYNFHPGSHVGQGLEAGIKGIAGVLNEVLKADTKTWVLLECMSGKGSEVGGSFDELKSIINLVEHNQRLGVCLDTCHVHDAGYDIVSNLDGVMTEFDKVLGLNRLKAVHLNDSMNPLGSRKDRHAKIGEGYIGIEAFKRIINHPALRELPFNLETPNELDGYAREIEMLRGFYID